MRNQKFGSSVSMDGACRHHCQVIGQWPKCFGLDMPKYQYWFSLLCDHSLTVENKSSEPYLRNINMVINVLRSWVRRKGDMESFSFIVQIFTYFPSCQTDPSLCLHAAGYPKPTGFSIHKVSDLLQEFEGVHTRCVEIS